MYEVLSRGWAGLVRKHLTLICLDAGGIMQLGAMMCAHQRGTSLLQESRGRDEVRLAERGFMEAVKTIRVSVKV